MNGEKLMHLDPDVREAIEEVIDAAVAEWKEGVEKANLLSQRFAAEADAAFKARDAALAEADRCAAARDRADAALRRLRALQDDLMALHGQRSGREAEEAQAKGHHATADTLRSVGGAYGAAAAAIGAAIGDGDEYGRTNGAAPWPVRLSETTIRRLVHEAAAVWPLRAALKGYRAAHHLCRVTPGDDARCALCLRADAAADAAPPPPDRWAKIETEDEARGCYPCDTCNGFRAHGAPCAACTGRLAALSSALTSALGGLAVAPVDDPKWLAQRDVVLASSAHLVPERAYAEVEARVFAVLAGPWPTLTGYAGACLACNIEAAIGTEETPHPVPKEFHTCAVEPAAAPHSP
jgi:hypothetical protein